MAEHTESLVHVEVRRMGTTIRVGVGGELDLASVPTLDRRLSEALREAPETLLLNLGPVEFLDSTAIHLLLGLRERTTAAGVALIVTRPKGPAGGIFTLCGLDETFPDVERRPARRGFRTGPERPAYITEWA